MRTKASRSNALELDDPRSRSYSHLHAAQYRAEETDHAQVLDDIDSFNDQLLENRRHGEQYCTAETKHIADELVLSWRNKMRNINFTLPVYDRT